METLYLPTLHTFANNNSFTGSCGALRFKITPQVVMENAKEVDMAASSLKAEFWHGLYCYEKSDMEGERSFPMSEAGRQEMRNWLEAQMTPE